MIIKISRAPPYTHSRVSDFLYENQKYVKENFPQCKSKEEIMVALRDASDNWNILIVDQEPVALFSLHSTGPEATLGGFCVKSNGALRASIPILQSDLRNMKKVSSVIMLPTEFEELFSEAGYRKTNTLVTVSREVSETQLMPILPMLNPGERDFPAIAKLMLECCANSKDKRFQDIKAVEAHLRNLMKGTSGTYLADASFITGAPGNLVSACFIASELPRIARVVELFTHPLYRARGLATTELARGMNRLQKLGIVKLNALIPQSNEVALRLFTKLEFEKIEGVVEMTAPLDQR